MKLDATFLITRRPVPVADPNQVRITKFQKYSYVAGPGRRCVLWVAGCHRRCPGCFQSHYFDFQAGKLASIDDLAEQVLAVDDVEGLTISGGEPFEQSESLAHLCRQIRDRSNLSILAYTGYTIEALRRRSVADRDFLGQLDLLIDGEYRESLRGPYLWRGSSNQRLHDLKDACNGTESCPPALGDEESVQLVLEDSRLVVGGFPAPELEDQLRQSLARRGIILGSSEIVKSEA